MREMIEATAPDSVGVITPAMIPLITTTGISAGTRPSSRTLSEALRALRLPAGRPGPNTPNRKMTRASADTIRIRARCRR